MLLSNILDLGSKLNKRDKSEAISEAYLNKYSEYADVQNQESVYEDLVQCLQKFANYLFDQLKVQKSAQYLERAAKIVDEVPTVSPDLIEKLGSDQLKICFHQESGVSQAERQKILKKFSSFLKEHPEIAPKYIS